jgi:hypothetical protein
MYIPEFWCGVAVTLLFETVALIVTVIHFGRKTEEAKKGQSCNGKEKGT